MEAFKRHSISMFNRLEAHVPATKLVFDDDGQPDVEFQGQKFYDGRYDDYIDEQIQDFLKKPYRFGLSIPQPSDLDNFGETYLNNVLRRATQEAHAEFTSQYSSMKTFFVTVLGIGLGDHLARIAELSECTMMFIVDLNIENLYHSLELFDWETLLEGRTKKGGQVLFFIGDNAANLFNNIRVYVRSTNTPAIDGMLLLQHYKNALFTQILQEVSKQGNLFLAGLGFYNDESKMLENSHATLSTGTAHIYTRQEDSLIPYPCFIVGCGPSLDADLEHIKRLADRAIIISSGSALGPLLNAGITPDFQLEVENEGILPIMQHVSEIHEISGICLVTSTTVEPEIVKYFDRIIYHFRPALMPFSIFSNDPKNTIPFHDPSVVNSSLGFAQDLGFREYYFFGCDMGTFDADLHHARNSYHFTEDAQLPDNDFCIELPANFGGSTFTSNGLNWVKAQLEMAMASKLPGRKYFNCSDGAHLNHAVAKFAKSVTLDPIENKNFKAEIVQKIYDSSPVMTREKFDEYWDHDTVIETINTCFDDLRDIIAGATFLIDMDYLKEINNIINSLDTPIKRGIGTWLRGTLQMMLLSTVFYCNRLKRDDNEIIFEDIICEEINNVLTNCTKNQ